MDYSLFEDFQDTNDLEATFYSVDVNDNEETVSLSTGSYDSKALNAIGIADNSIYRVDVPKELKVTLFSNDSFSGDNLVLTSSSDSLGKLDKRTNSLKINDLSTPTSEENKVVIYSQDFYGYETTPTYLSVGGYDSQAMDDLGIVNDSIYKINIPEGLKITLFSNDNFSGNAYVVNPNVSLNSIEPTYSILIERTNEAIAESEHQLKSVLKLEENKSTELVTQPLVTPSLVPQPLVTQPLVTQPLVPPFIVPPPLVSPSLITQTIPNQTLPTRTISTSTLPPPIKTLSTQTILSTKTILETPQHPKTLYNNFDTFIKNSFPEEWISDVSNTDLIIVFISTIFILTLYNFIQNRK